MLCKLYTDANRSQHGSNMSVIDYVCVQGFSSHLTLDIDELLPDEDECNAIEALQGANTIKRKVHDMEDSKLYLSNHVSNTMTLTTDNHGTYDVLADHQDCNHKPKAPSADHLHHLAVHHRCQTKSVADSDKEVVPNSEVEELDNVEENLSNNSEGLSRRCAKCNSTCHCAKPTQLQFYLCMWADILERAKEFFCLWVIKECPFPEHSVHLLSTQHALEKAMEEFEAKHHEVKDDKYRSTHHNLSS